jgi:hypothetical protein
MPAVLKTAEKSSRLIPGLLDRGDRKSADRMPAVPTALLA